MTDAHDVVDRVFRLESGRAVAGLIRVLGDFDFAEEAVQEAFVAALEHWPHEGVPAAPPPAGHRSPTAGASPVGEARAIAGRGRRGGPAGTGRTHRVGGGHGYHRRRPPAAPVYLLPSRAGPAGTGGAHAAYPRRVAD